MGSRLRTSLPASLNGGRSLVVTFAGDDYYEGVGEIAPVTVYQRSQFVVWGEMLRDRASVSG